MTVPEQFAGSIFDLRPATTYEIERTARDPDGPADRVLSLSGTTRAVPADPPAPQLVNVSDGSGLQSALDNAQPGTIIVLADGTYSGTFSIDASGTAANPIVIRGQSRDGVILDGGGAGGNVLEAYGSFVHIERLTLQNANRGLRFQSNGTEGNVARRLRIRDVTLGLGSTEDQKDFYVCDNDLQGPLTWPSVYTDDGGAHANDDGINLRGDGHVVCHNRIIGFGDAMKIEQDGSRAVDFYGNEVLSAYDNGLEMDTTAGNGRALFNRFTNNFMPLSFQPIHGGPVYVLRNVAVNYASEAMKFHNETSGILVYHNTFVSPDQPLVVWDDTTSHHFAIENNLFIGPGDLAGNRTVEWDGTVDDGIFDYNGYLPDAGFKINFVAGTVNVGDFAALQAAGVEAHGLVLGGSPFESGLLPPADYTVTMTPQDVTLAAGSPPVDRGLVLPNINDGYKDAAPDLGATERGCALPIYGIRPEGTDESNEPFGCDPGTVQPDEDGGHLDAGEDGGVVSDDGQPADPGDPAAADDGGAGRQDGTDGAPGELAGGCGCAGAAGAASLGLIGLLGWVALGVRLLRPSTSRRS
jgi:hypothetical protein